MSFDDTSRDESRGGRRGVTELLVAAHDGRIAFAKPRAKRWLRDFFQLPSPPRRLPRALRDWLAQPRGKRGQCVPFLVDGADAQLLVRLAPLEVEGLRCLLLELRPPASRAVASLGRGLTERQSEVLLWLLQGKSNAEIAAIMKRKPDTVAKHLREVFDKLGVDNRTSAIALAWQAQTGR